MPLANRGRKKNLIDDVDHTVRSLEVGFHNVRLVHGRPGCGDFDRCLKPVSIANCGSLPYQRGDS